MINLPSMALPNSIREINALSIERKIDIYKELLPPWLKLYDLNFGDLTINGIKAVEIRCIADSRSVEITVRRDPADKDPLVYFHMTDTFNNQLLVLFAMVNDPESPRFNIDIDEEGNSTQFGTSRRNRPVEILAKNAGLAPGQVRRGLRVFRQTIPYFERFVASMGHDLFLIEPLAYHNAISFERYGFGYIRGYQDMLWIDQAFRPGGELFTHLSYDNTNPFRVTDAWQSIRGRSWAIHDGILGRPFSGFQMYKRIGRDSGINTFPGGVW